MNKNKNVLCVDWENKFNYHDLILRELINIATHRGLNVSVFKDNSMMLRNFIISDQGHAMYNWGPYIAMVSSVLHSVPTKLRARILKKSHFILEDHPYAAWIYDDIKRFDTEVNFFGLPDSKELIEIINPNIKFSCEDVIYRTPQLDESVFHKERYIDVIIAMDFRSGGPLTSQISSIYPGVFPVDQSFFDDIYHSLIKNLTVSPIDMLKSALSDRGMSLKNIAAEQRPFFDYLMRAMHIIDMNVRRQRRRQITLDFMTRFPHLKIFVCALEGDLNMDVKLSNVTFLGKIDHIAYHALLSRSKYNLFSNPTYTNHLNQRVIDSISYGCGTICDYAPALDSIHNKTGYSVTGLDLLEDSLSNYSELPLKLVNTYLKIKDRKTFAQAFWSSTSLI